MKFGCIRFILNFVSDSHWTSPISEGSSFHNRKFLFPLNLKFLLFNPNVIFFYKTYKSKLLYDLNLQKDILRFLWIWLLLRPWLNGLRLIWLRNFQVKTPLGPQESFGTQFHCRTPKDLQVKIVLNWSQTLGECSFPFVTGPMFTFKKETTSKTITNRSKVIAHGFYL